MRKLTRNSKQSGRRRDDAPAPDETVGPAKAEKLTEPPTLIGTTIEEIAAHLRARPAPAEPEAGLPPPDKERLTAAIHTVIEWYSETLQVPSADAAPAAPAETGDEALVRRYLAMRSEWERREALLLAAHMNARFPRAMEHAPCAELPATAPASLPAAEPEAAARRTALLVDDTSDILITVGAFLWSMGFDVLRASDAETALEILADGSRVDLLVADHAMPGMTGSDLVIEACQRNPNLRAMIITGYPDTKALANLPANVAVLAKPFRRAGLTAHIRALFGADQVADAARATVRAF